LTLIYTSNAALTDLEDYLRNEFLKYDNYSEYGSVKNNDLTMEAEIEGIVITANPSIDIDTGFTKVMFTCGATK